MSISSKLVGLPKESERSKAVPSNECERIKLMPLAVPSRLVDRIIGMPAIFMGGLGGGGGPPAAAAPSPPGVVEVAAADEEAAAAGSTGAVVPGGSGSPPSPGFEGTVAPEAASLACAAATAGVSGSPGVERRPLARESLRSRCRLFWNQTCTCRADTFSLRERPRRVSRPAKRGE